MRIEPFQLERWMTTYELSVKWDIAESGIAPMSTREVLDFLPPDERPETLERLLDLRLGYSEARGSAELRELLAATYVDTSSDNILVTTGGGGGSSSPVTGWSSSIQPTSNCRACRAPLVARSRFGGCAGTASSGSISTICAHCRSPAPR